MNRLRSSRGRRRAWCLVGACLLPLSTAAAGPPAPLGDDVLGAVLDGDTETRRVTPPWSRRPLDLTGLPLERLVDAGTGRLRLETTAGVVGVPLALALDQGAFLVVARDGRVLGPDDDGPYWLVPTAPGVSAAWAIAVRRIEGVAIEDGIPEGGPPARNGPAYGSSTR